MNVPKFIRKWVYKRMLKKLDENSKEIYPDTYLCHFCKYQFPYINIKHYPELWNRRFGLPWYIHDKPAHAQVWFMEEFERRRYVKKALDLVTNKTK
jgi:hypothetical protein